MQWSAVKSTKDDLHGLLRALYQQLTSADGSHSLLARLIRRDMDLKVVQVLGGLHSDSDVALTSPDIFRQGTYTSHIWSRPVRLATSQFVAITLHGYVWPHMNPGPT